VVAAPGKIERPAGDKVKTDQRDAERVLRLLMIDGLHPVRVPSGQEEALRDVVRAHRATARSLVALRASASSVCPSWDDCDRQCIELAPSGPVSDSD
jgi:transposase